MSPLFPHLLLSKDPAACPSSKRGPGEGGIGLVAGDLALLTLTVVLPLEHEQGGGPGPQAWGGDLENPSNRAVLGGLGPVIRPPPRLAPSSANVGPPSSSGHGAQS